MKRDQSATILNILLFSIAIMLSGNVFAGKPGAPPPEDMATQAELDAAISSITPPIRVIGDHLADGSIVFWVDETGQHGLAAQPYDAINPDNSNSYMGWYKAIEVVENFGLGWRLPNKHELNLLYLQKDLVGGFAGYSYWSSTDSDSGPWVRDFTNGDQAYTSKGGPGGVRAVRAF